MGLGDEHEPLRRRVFPLCAVKKIEVPHLRKCKGRVVFQADDAPDEFGFLAEFPDHGP